MGISPAEVRLKRLLASTPQQGNPMKLLHNVAAMREQLALLTGDSGHDNLPVIPTSKAEEYAKQIDELAESLDASSPLLIFGKPSEAAKMLGRILLLNLKGN
jgi:hypothetical protein